MIKLNCCIILKNNPHLYPSSVMEGLKNWKYNLKGGVDYLYKQYNRAAKKYKGDDLIKATYYGYNRGNPLEYNENLNKSGYKIGMENTRGFWKIYRNNYGNKE